MKALVYHGPGERGWDSVDDPTILDPADAIVPMRLIASGRLDPSLFATHHFPLGDTMAAYDVFVDAANSGALKVVLQGAGESSSAPATTEQSVAVA